ncbi:hypothetical protein [Candidatus Leptofilum sp.]|uniref:hypothetical protein n=1 Tax=Candidatus Leptofilum sp. TaxID=3241576 RepID=UPI003B5B77A5
MNRSKFVKFGGILIVLLALAALVGSSLTFAQDEPDTDDTVTIPEDGSETEDRRPNGRFGHHGPRGLKGHIDRDEAQALLADELGVTVDELEAAHDAAKDALEAEDGRPNRDEMKELIATELGVTVEELEAARDVVMETLLAQLVEDGVITQEELDEMLAIQELRGLPQEIFSRDDAQAVIAEALGLTVEELTAARDDGTRLPELAEEQGVDMETLMTAVSDARTAAIEAAVADGIITQEQADILLSHEGRGFGRRGHGHGGHGGPRGGGPRGGSFGSGNGNGLGNPAGQGA